ncbi:1,4-alpha-glucan branching enzyme [Streptomyces sp. NPDC126522]|uniref:1,4-alpha-glucan branching enzyme n=1 Tax=Streptomyces sp. NPDC126522 TaxID=3155211 RepID=UPI00332AAE12
MPAAIGEADPAPERTAAAADETVLAPEQTAAAADEATPAPEQAAAAIDEADPAPEQAPSAPEQAAAATGTTPAPEPDPTPEPDLAPESGLASEPEATPNPIPASESGPAQQPNPASESSDLVSESEPAPEPAHASASVPNSESDPDSDPEFTPEPDLVSESGLTSESEAAAQEPHLASESDFASVSGTTLEAGPTSDPDPVSESGPASEIQPAQETHLVSASDSASEPVTPSASPEPAEPSASSGPPVAPEPAELLDPADAPKTVTPPTPATPNPAEPTAPTSPAAPSSVSADTPEPTTPTPAISPALNASDRDRLLHGTHHAPHSVLGAHPVPGGVAFRAFRPFARGVTVVAGELRAELHDDGDGFFSGLVPLQGVPEYRLSVAYDGAVQEVEDAYRFLPALGDLDLHLIGEGRHEELWQALGARTMTHQGVAGTRFTVWAPDAQGVRLAGTFNFWDGTGAPLRSLGATGVWELFMPGIGEGELYKFEITRPDGSKTLRADPMARRTEVPPSTSSIVTASHYTWGDEEWLAQRPQVPAHKAPFSVYELHLASWRPGLTYRQLAEQLPAYIKDLGFTHVELMPVAEHPFGGSWGYQVTGFYAPTARLGTPDDFKFLVDSLHQAGIGVLMDWVPAHFPRDDWALAEFDGRPLYEHEDPLRAAHPDWGTLEFDFGRREVRNFLVANAVYWCEEFHIDGLRVDAVASMLYLDYSREPDQWTPNEHGGRENLDAVAFLQEMNATVYRRVPGVVTIAEESTAWDGVTRATHHIGPGGFGGLGFGLKWNMGWMHDSLDYMSHEPVHRKFHHHEMTFSMVYAYSENYVLPISHDEVVHGKRSLVSKMPGDWWQQRANHRAYLAFMWAHPGKQLLFMGQEFAQGAEWSETRGPDWWLLDPAYGAEADHRGVRNLVRDLNTVYRHTPALWQLDTDPAGFQWITGDSAEDNVLAFLRYDADGSPLLAVSNFSPVVRHDYRLGAPDDIPAWHETLNTDTALYGGGDITNPAPIKPEPQPWHGRPASIRVTLPPLATVWLRPA